MEKKLTGTGGKKKARREKFIFLFLLCCSILSSVLFFIKSGNAERLMEKKNLLALSELGLLFLYIFAVLLFGKTICISKKRFFFYFSLPLLLSAYLHRFFLPLAVSFLYFFLPALFFGFLLSGKISYYPKRMVEILSELPCRIEIFFILPFLYIQISGSNIALDYDSLRYGLRSAYILFSPQDTVQAGLFSMIKGFFSSHGLLNAVYSYPKGLEVLTAPLSFLSGYGFLLAFQIWIYLALGFALFLLARKINPKSGMGVFLLFYFFSSIGNMAVTVKTDNITLLLQVLSLYFYAKGERKNSLSMLILSYSFKPTAVVFSTLIFIGLFFDSLLKKTIKGFFYEENRFKRGSKQEVIEEESVEKGSGRFCIFGTRKEGSTALILLAILFTGLITFRTFLITGLPFSTTFTGIFKAMGFSVKWPFNLDAHMDYSGEKVGLELVASFIRRVFSFLFYPVGEDMAHVSIAWSGPLFPLILFLAFRNAFCGIISRGSNATMNKRCKSSSTKESEKTDRIERDRKESGTEQKEGDSFEEKKETIKEQNCLYLRIVFFLISFFSLLSFSMLWQIDGNYYILWDCLALLLAASSLWGEGETFLWKPNLLCSEKRISLWRSNLIKGIFSLVYLVSVLITLVTSWAGAVGFTPIDFMNKGYYDHFAVEMEKQAERGSLPLFLKMAENPNNHVLAVSETPDCYRIPCVLESITDVEGSGGSPGLYDDPLYFAWFLKWSEIDYIYMEKSFLEEEREERAKGMLQKMAELGLLIEPKFADLTKTQDSFPEYLLVKVNQTRLEYAWREEPYPALSKEEETDANRVSAWIKTEYNAE